jgi:hypothetical protein
MFHVTGTAHRLTTKGVIHPNPLVPSIKHTRTLECGRSDGNRGTPLMANFITPYLGRAHGYNVRSAAYSSSRYPGQSNLKGSDSGTREDSGQDSLVMAPRVRRNM